MMMLLLLLLLQGQLQRTRPHWSEGLLMIARMLSEVRSGEAGMVLMRVGEGRESCRDGLTGPHPYGKTQKPG